MLKGATVWKHGALAEDVSVVIQNGFVQLNANQFKVLCKDKNYWIYLVVPSASGRKVFEFSRLSVLPRIDAYTHYDFRYKKPDFKQRVG